MNSTWRSLDWPQTRELLRERMCGESGLPMFKAESVTCVSLEYITKTFGKLFVIDFPMTDEVYDKAATDIEFRNFSDTKTVFQGFAQVTLDQKEKIILPPVIEIIDEMAVLILGIPTYFYAQECKVKPNDLMCVLVRHVMLKPTPLHVMPKESPRTYKKYMDINTEWVRSERGERRQFEPEY